MHFIYSYKRCEAIHQWSDTTKLDGTWTEGTGGGDDAASGKYNMRSTDEAMIIQQHTHLE